MSESPVQSVFWQHSELPTSVSRLDMFWAKKQRPDAMWRSPDCGRVGGVDDVRDLPALGRAPEHVAVACEQATGASADRELQERYRGTLLGCGAVPQVDGGASWSGEPFPWSISDLPLYSDKALLPRWSAVMEMMEWRSVMITRSRFVWSYFVTSF